MQIEYRPQSISSRVESPKALQAFEDYWALGAGRNIDALHKRYSTTLSSPPSLSTLHSWKSIFQWERRVVARQALAAAEVEKIRRQQVADMESLLYEKGMALLVKAADNVITRLDDYAAGNTRAIGALAAVQAIKLGSELATRGQRQPSTITREEVVRGDGQPLTLEAFLQLLPEGTRDAVLEAAYWELQPTADSGEVRELPRASAEFSDSAGPLRPEAPEGPLVEQAD